MKKALDLVGKKFGKLNVLHRENNNKFNQSMWACICECGNKKVISGTCLKSGHTSSCGCYQKEQMSKARTTHGHAKHYTHTSEYGIWVQIKLRCTNLNDK